MKLSEITSRYQIGHVLNEFGLTGVGAEIGVAFGENAEKILETSRLEKLLLIDNWNYVPGQDAKGYGDVIKNWDGCYDHCRKRLRRFGIRASYMRMSSQEAIKRVGDNSLDFVYIDGNHMSPYVDEDISSWYGKVKPGGIIGGHDYYLVDTPEYRCDVKDAVNSFFEGRMDQVVLLPETDSSWFFVKQ